MVSQEQTLSLTESKASPDPLHVHDDGLLLGEDVVILQLILEVHPHCSRGHYKVFINKTISLSSLVW